MRSIYIKEINSFFSSIVGYIAVIAFLAFCGIMLWVFDDFGYNILNFGYATLDNFFALAPALLIFLIPAITMRSFADEFRGGTIEWLSTKPLSDMDIILGKYLASLTLVAFALLPTLIYAYTIENLSDIANNVDFGAMAGSYIGLLFLAAGFTAIGVFCSSITNNQIVGFLVAMFACFILYMGVGSIAHLSIFPNGVGYYIGMVGMSFHYESISRGLVDSRDIIYFLSVIILFISLTRLSLNSRTWDTSSQD